MIGTKRHRATGPAPATKPAPAVQRPSGPVVCPPFHVMIGQPSKGDIVFSFINKAAIYFSVDMLAKVAASPEAFDCAVPTAISLKVTIESYFFKYGSTKQLFEYHPSPGFYIGYVKVPNKSEFLSVVIMHEKGSYMSSFWPEIDYGQDMLGLIGKKIFADKIAEKLILESAGRL